VGVDMTEEQIEKPKRERKKAVIITAAKHKTATDKYYAGDTPKLSAKEAQALVDAGVAEFA